MTDKSPKLFNCVLISSNSNSNHLKVRSPQCQSHYWRVLGKTASKSELSKFSQLVKQKWALNVWDIRASRVFASFIEKVVCNNHIKEIGVILI